MVSLKTSSIEDPEENKNAFKPGIDIVCVIDTRGSMNTNKLWNKTNLNSIFSNISAGGGTDINSGMTLALKTLKDRKVVNHVSSIFLLSGAEHSVN